MSRWIRAAAVGEIADAESTVINGTDLAVYNLGGD
jgi:hypothetical protein